MHQNNSSVSRREFVKVSGVVATAAAVSTASARNWAWAGGSDTIRIGVIGCGGRGTGAATDALDSGPGTKIVALADVFRDRVQSCRDYLKENYKDRADVADDHTFTGFDCYKQLLATSGIDSVILATTPHFRPAHFAAAVEAGKHVFMEKPVAVDAPGVRMVMQAAELAAQKGLSVVSGTQRRHEDCYLQALQRVRDGAIGRLVHGRVYWNQGGLWVKPKQPEWSDMEWQIRNWLYFTWLSGDHIVEQHVHNIDVANWVVGATPKTAYAMGGRQVRTGPEYGHIFDHFAVEYEYPDGTIINSMCRQIDGTDSRVWEAFSGTDGTLRTTSGQAEIKGKSAWRYSGSMNPYKQEHVDLYASIAAGKPINEGKRIAESVLTAIMGRMAAYTGKTVTWEQALASKERLGPTTYELGPLPVPPVAVPGRTPLV